MTPIDRLIVEAARRGTWADISTGLPAHDAPNVSVSASLLRDLLLGTASVLGDCPAPLGVRIRGAVIEGVLDLQDCCGSDGRGLPPLLLERCRIVGDVAQPEHWVIVGDHSEFSRLTLRDCSAGRISLHGARIRSDLDLDGLHPLDGQRSCQVFADGSRLDGSVTARGAKLRIPPGLKLARDPSIADYALNFRHSHIQGSLLLQPDFVAEGGVNLGRATVQGNVWAESAQLLAARSTAFSAQSLSCQGVVALRGSTRDGRSLQCMARGGVDLLDASLGWLDMRGIDISKEVPDDEPGAWALTLSALRVRDHLWLQSLSDAIPTRIKGSVDMVGCHVGGDLVMSDVFIEAPSSQAIEARNMRIGGSLRLDRFNHPIQLEGSHIDHDLLAINANIAPATDGYSLMARNVQVGNDMWIAEFQGSINIELARIGGALMIRGKDLAAVNAKDLEVRGSVTLSGTARQADESQTLRFDGGKYHGEFSIEGLRFRPFKERSIVLSIEDAMIERDLHFQALGVDGLAWEQRAQIQRRVTPLGFYEGWSLVEELSRLQDGRYVVVSYLWRKDKPPVLLNGSSTPIHKLNASMGLKLRSSEMALAYMRFFCAYVWGDEGAFRIIESAAALEPYGEFLEPATATAPEGEASAEPSPEAPAKIVPTPAVFAGADAENGWKFNAFVFYANVLFEAVFLVRAEGNIEMTHSAPLRELKSKASLPYAFVAPMRVLTSELGAHAADHFWGDSIAGMSVPRLEPSPQLVKETLDELLRSLDGRSGWQADSARVSLRGLSAGALRYRDGSFGAGVLLWLDGFEYRRIERDSRPSGAAEAFPENQAEAGVLQGRVRRLFTWLRTRMNEPSAVTHCELLDLQYQAGQPSSPRNYRPQPYEQLARVLRNHGDDEQAKRVTLEKLRLERLLVHPWWAQPWYWVLEKGFDHGLFARKSVAIFFGLWIAGTLAFDFANYGRVGLPLGSTRTATLSWPRLTQAVLVLDTVSVSTVLGRDPAQPGKGLASAMPISKTPADYADEAPCGDQIEPLWYALDVLVPLLDLKQEDKCTITSKDTAWGWRAFKALYALIGAVVTSIMLLTVSGVLRRRVEA